MGVQELVLLLMVLFSFCSPALFAQVNKNFVPENTHGKREDNGTHRSSSIISGGSGMVNQSKYTSALIGGGRSAGNGGNGNGGQTNSSPQGGGNGVVPVYGAGAGAAAQRRNHKGAAATYTPCWKGRLAVLIATVTACFLLR